MMSNGHIDERAEATSSGSHPPAGQGGTSTVVLDVRGMTCGACERHVGEALATVPGVSEVLVNRTTSSATVRWASGVPDIAPLVDAVLAAGYDASVASVAGDTTMTAVQRPPGGCRCCEVPA